MLIRMVQRWESKRRGENDLSHGRGFSDDCHYLVRFDDICPTMNWTAWEGIEGHLIRNDVRPILSVIPDNQDPKLMVDEPRADFWEQVRKWQSMGWTIALHGYQHVYVNRHSGLVGVTPQSEFASLPYAEQEEKLRKGLAIFAKHGIRADAWVAPSHSFDETTVEILKKLEVKVISDGLTSWPYTEGGGMTWVPQQLWSFRVKPAGVWTICNHHNDWTEQKVKWFGEMLEIYSGKLTDLATVLDKFAGRRRTLADRLEAYHRFVWSFRIRPFLSRKFRSMVGYQQIAE